MRAWRYLPVDFPPWQTVYFHFKRWNRRGVTDWILTKLREQVRRAIARQPEPTVGVIDSQSVRAADAVHRDSRGMTAGRRSTAGNGSSSPTPPGCRSPSGS
ncbi:transposase [Verrucosispora sp. NA02020]|nr:transposase [Verrucosispora sp. NA02020]QKW12247.1 transposase [Verrucosispora sp. NA02020]